MSKEDILKAFGELSPEDQETVRAEIAGTKVTGEEKGACCPPGFAEHFSEMMEKMKAGGHPMAICKEMMGKTAANAVHEEGS